MWKSRRKARNSSSFSNRRSFTNSRRDSFQTFFSFLVFVFALVSVLCCVVCFCLSKSIAPSFFLFSFLIARNTHKRVNAGCRLRLPLSGLFQAEVDIQLRQGPDHLGERGQVGGHVLVELLLVIAELGVEILAVRGRLHGHLSEYRNGTEFRGDSSLPLRQKGGRFFYSEDGADEHAVVGSQGDLVGSSERIAHLLLGIFQTALQGNVKHLQSPESIDLMSLAF